MGEILGLIIELLGEVLLQVFGEVLCEFGLQSLAEVFKSRTVQNPVLAGFGHALLGMAVGGISLLVFPDHFIHQKSLRMTAVMLSPVMAGFCMSVLGSWRRQRGQRLIRLDSFSYGFIFALGMALVRRWFTAS